MRFVFFSLLVLCTYSCSSFSQYAVDTQKTECGSGNPYVCFSNTTLNWSYSSFGGMYFATNRQEFNKIKSKIKGTKKPDFKNILLYGNS